MTEETSRPYSLSRIAVIWTLAALPMALLGWVVAPALAPHLDTAVGIRGISRVIVLTAGLMWQFVLVLLVVHQEERSFSWTTIKRRLWLNSPRDPGTGGPRNSLWFWLVPLLMAHVACLFLISPLLNRFWGSVFPFLAEPPGHDFSGFLESAENRAQLAGAWWFLALFLLLAVFNTFLGEELLFRGVLLPKMNGVFGKWDWIANGVLFGIYHLHQPWMIPGGLLGGVLFYAFPAKYFRCSWMAIALHSGQSIFFGILILGLVLGLG